MNHIVDTCSLTKFEGGLNLLHEADDHMAGISSDCSTCEINSVLYCAQHLCTMLCIQAVLEETGWEERLWNDLFCVMWDVKSLLAYVSLLSFILSTADFHCEFTRDKYVHCESENDTKLLPITSPSNNRFS